MRKGPAGAPNDRLRVVQGIVEKLLSAENPL